MIEYTTFPNEKNCVGESTLSVMQEECVFIVQAFGYERRHIDLRVALRQLSEAVALDLMRGLSR